MRRPSTDEYISHATAAPGVSLSVGHARGRHLSATRLAGLGVARQRPRVQVRGGARGGDDPRRHSIRMRGRARIQRVFCLTTPLFCTYRTVTTVQRGT